MLFFSSINANGLRSSDKLDSILTTVSCDILCLQETKWDESILEKVTQKWKGLFYVSNGHDRKGGVAILFHMTNIRDVTLIHKDKEVRMLVMDCIHNEHLIRIINVYAPNVEKDRNAFFKSLGHWCTYSTVVLGDFNVVQSRLDISYQNVFKGDVSRKELLRLQAERGLCDVWRNSFPNMRTFSSKQIVNGILKQSRIDLCLCSASICRDIVNPRYEHNVWSDHCTFSCELDTMQRKRGGGTWCLNSSLLEDKAFIECMTRFMKDANDEMCFSDDVLQWWSDFKVRLKKKCINFSINKKWREGLLEKKLREELKIEELLLEQQQIESTEKYECVKKC